MTLSNLVSQYFGSDTSGNKKSRIEKSTKYVKVNLIQIHSLHSFNSDHHTVQLSPIFWWFNNISYERLHIGNFSPGGIIIYDNDILLSSGGVWVFLGRSWPETEGNDYNTLIELWRWHNSISPVSGLSSKWCLFMMNVMNSSGSRYDLIEEMWWFAAGFLLYSTSIFPVTQSH